MITFEEKVYVFRFDKYWVFRLNAKNTDKPLGHLIEAKLDIGFKWKGIDGNKSKFTIRDNKIVAISSDKWNELEPNGEITKSEEVLPQNLDEDSDSTAFPMISEETPEENYIEEHRGAVIQLNNTFYVEISGNLLIFYELKRKKWVKRKPLPLLEFDYNFPPNINSAFKSSNGYFYFIKKDKYCIRKQNSKHRVGFKMIS